MKPVKYVRAIFQALPFFGSIHLGVLLSVAYLRGSWDELNFFIFDYPSSLSFDWGRHLDVFRILDIFWIKCCGCIFLVTEDNTCTSSLIYSSILNFPGRCRHR